jgi:hypothetical protein
MLPYGKYKIFSILVKGRDINTGKRGPQVHLETESGMMNVPY